MQAHAPTHPPGSVQKRAARRTPWPTETIEQPIDDVVLQERGHEDRFPVVEPVVEFVAAFEFTLQDLD